jgi:hypothetical protein
MNNLRLLLLNNVMRKAAKKERAHQTHNLNTAQSITILFDGNSPLTFEFFKKTSESLEKTGKKICLIAVSTHNHQHNYNPKCLTPKDFRYNLTPKVHPPSPTCSDLLITFNPYHIPTLANLALLIKADMKIGTATMFPNDLDIQIEVPTSEQPDLFYREMQQFLTKIVIS